MKPTRQTPDPFPQRDREGTSPIRTGILGGSFNPVHNGHVFLARQLLAAAGLDEIWFVVSPQNPLKRQEELLDGDIRLRMVRIALQHEPRLVACGYELGMPRPSYMWHTLRSMVSDYPGREFVLLIGADNWRGFNRWFAWREILGSHSVVIYPRRGFWVDVSSLPSNVSLADTDLFDMSSTEIRRKIKAGISVDGLVAPGVADLISKERLYL